VFRLTGVATGHHVGHTSPTGSTSADTHDIELYYQHANGSFQDVPNGEMLIYYLARGPDSYINTTKTFPNNFRMLSGDPFKRVYDDQTLTWDNSTAIAQRVSFNCIDAAAGSSKPTFIPKILEAHLMFHPVWQDYYVRDYNCTGGLRAQITFPSCWDGHTLYAPDQSHTAYLSGVSGGRCPSTHPVLLPMLFYGTEYAMILLYKF
jgi:hypothetical protein